MVIISFRLSQQSPLRHGQQPAEITLVNALSIAIEN
jgi:hypothetical protein